ncbi:MAG: hypothetical protein ACTHKK_09180, partial [Candidatus Nitrosocosmicus sp.]
METAIQNWINSKVIATNCSFPDCKNESTCQCLKCFNLYCHSHLQIHFGFCNNLNDATRNTNDLLLS